MHLLSTLVSRTSPRRVISVSSSSSSSSSTSSSTSDERQSSGSSAGDVFDVEREASGLQKAFEGLSLGDKVPAKPSRSFGEDTAPGRTARSSKGKAPASRQPPPLHPFFHPNSSAPALNPRGPAPAPRAPNPPSSRAVHTSSDAPPRKKPPSSRRGRKAYSTAPPAVNEQPYYSYHAIRPTPTRVYVRNNDEANDLVQMLEGPLGMDMEWKVSFGRKGMTPGRTALLQLADDRLILLIQLSALKTVPVMVKKLLENPLVPKMGVNIRNDARKLLRDFSVRTRNIVELSYLARAVDDTLDKNRKLISLAKLVERYTQRVLDKGEPRMSDWEQVLTDEQLEYASNDVHSSMRVGRHLFAVAAEQKREIAPEVYTMDGTLTEPVVPPPLPPPPLNDSTASTVPAKPPPRRPPGDEEHSTFTVPSPSRETFAPSRKPPYLPSAVVPKTAPVPKPKEHQPHGPGPQPHELRAYLLWYTTSMSVDDLCVELRVADPDDVVEDIVHALMSDQTLPFDAARMRRLLEHGPNLSAATSKWLLANARDVLEDLAPAM